MKQKNLVLMVVAVGCGLVAAFLTSQMSASTKVEQVEVLVAAKDIAVGTMITKDDMKTLVKRKKISKDAVPQNIVETEEELVEKRLARPIREGETFNKADVSRGSVVQIPPGMQMFTLPIGANSAVAGFVGPGSRVDVLATLRLGNTLKAMPILVNMLILAVDTNTTYAREGGAFQNLNSVSFAVDRKQALLLELAKARGCSVSLLLRNPEEKTNENDTLYDIDRVLKLLQDTESRAVIDAGPDDIAKPKKEEKAPAKPENPDPPQAPPPSPKVETVTVLVASETIPNGTILTVDLIAEKFKEKEFRKGDVEDAVADLKQYVGKELKGVVAKGQWVTGAMVGDLTPKPTPREEFTPPKPGPVTVAPQPGDTPKPDVKPEVKPAPAKHNYHDLTINTPGGTKTFRYEEVKPGEWKLLGEIDPNRPDATPRKTD